MHDKSTIKLDGKPVKARLSARKMTAHDGYCRKGELVVSRGLSERETFRVFVHEAFHLLFWQLDETVVDAASREFTDAVELAGLVEFED